MHVGLVLVTYGMLPEKLFASIPDRPHQLTWHVAHHGPDAALGSRIGETVRRMGGAFISHEDRGLSCSWNDGIKHAVDAGADIVLLLNDDLHFRDDGFGAFVEFSASEMAKEQVGLTFVTGLETDGPWKGVTQNQGYACCAMAPRLIERVGYFDENFWPAYYEDVDYTRRIAMTGLQIAIDPRCLVEHERSRTTRMDEALAATIQEKVRGCQNYLVKKWGGDLAQQTLHRPFDLFGPKIEYDDRAAPYGGEWLRERLPPG